MSTENLKREIGVRSLALAIINNTVGSGIFVLPAIIADGLGATAILAYFVCGIMVTAIGLCFADMGSKTNLSGGAYTYIESAFGPFAGFIANNIFWIGSCLSDAAVAAALVDTLKYFIPSLAIESYRMLTLLLLFSTLAFLNIRSVKNGVRLIEFSTLGKLLPLLLLVIMGASFIAPGNLKWEIAPTVNNIGAASLVLFFAFQGMEVPLSNGGEMKNPNRTVPRAILLGIGSVLVLYVCIQLVVQGVLGSQLPANKEAPMAAVAGIVFGKTGIILIVIAAAVSMFGALGGGILSIPRILFAGARDGLLPKPLAKVHPKFSTPYIAVIVYASFGFLIATSGGFKQLAIFASAALLCVYLGVVLASLKLRNKIPAHTTTRFRMPGGILAPVLAATGIFWLLSNLSLQELAGTAICMGLLSIIYIVMLLYKKKGIKPEDLSPTVNS